MRQFWMVLLGVVVMACPAALAADKEEGFVTIFDGKSMDGWKVAENPDTVKLVDGAMVTKGNRAHVFYTGDPKPFKDFELRLDIMTRKNSNGGVYIHTKYQPNGWPKYGFECQVNNSFDKDPRKTGSLYGVKDVMNVSPAKDDEWWQYSITVKGNTITLKVNGKVVNEYTEPDGTKAGEDFTRKIAEGTFALQAHDPGSEVQYKNIRVKRLD